jgi:uncharacterized membrane protein
MSSPSDIYTSFIDILFAVIIAESFVLLSGYSVWIYDLKSNALHFAILAFFYILVISSFVGWHRTIATDSQHPEKIIRFSLDGILLFFYYVGFTSVQNFVLVLTIVFIVFGLYFGWDIARYLEYIERKQDKNILLNIGLVNR